MVTIGEIMTSDVATVEPEMTLREASEILGDAAVSGAPVTAGERVVGVLSSTDILEFQRSSPGVPAEREDQEEWGRWGTADVWEEDESEDPATYFADYWADVSADMRERFASVEGPEWNVLEEHVVAEVMTRRVVALPPDAGAHEAARLMTEHRIHRVLVLAEDRLQGIVTTADLVRAIAEGRLADGS